jgi:hypothetical protein
MGSTQGPDGSRAMVCSALPHNGAKENLPGSLQGGQRHVPPQAQALAPSAFIRSPIIQAARLTMARVSASSRRPVRSPELVRAGRRLPKMRDTRATLLCRMRIDDFTTSRPASDARIGCAAPNFTRCRRFTPAQGWEGQGLPNLYGLLWLGHATQARL